MTNASGRLRTAPLPASDVCTIHISISARSMWARPSMVCMPPLVVLFAQDTRQIIVSCKREVAVHPLDRRLCFATVVRRCRSNGSIWIGVVDEKGNVFAFCFLIGSSDPIILAIASGACPLHGFALSLRVSSAVSLNSSVPSTLKKVPRTTMVCRSSE